MTEPTLPSTLNDDDGVKFNQFCEYHLMIVQGTFPDCWIPVPKLQRILGLTNLNKNTSSIPVQYKCYFHIQTNGGKQRVLHISIPAVKMILSKSRKSTAQIFARILNMEIDSYHCIPMETETVSFLQDVFCDETILLQHCFEKYYVDMYFPKYNLAVECDEDSSHSATKNKCLDAVRQQFIEQNYQCTFVRYRPQFDHKSIANAVRLIHQHILKKTIAENTSKSLEL